MSSNSDRIQWAMVPGSPEIWASDTGLIATLRNDGAGFQYLTLKMDKYGEMYVNVRGKLNTTNRRKVAALVLVAFGKLSNFGGSAIQYRDGNLENCRLENLFHGRKNAPDVGSLKPKRCLGNHCGHVKFMSTGPANRLCPVCQKINGSKGGAMEGVSDPDEVPEDVPSLNPPGSFTKGD